MPGLSSFNPLSRRSKGKSVKSPFEIRRSTAPLSPTHPYASPAIFDIKHERNPSQDSTVSGITDPSRDQVSPMKLDVDITEDSTDWFPEHLFPTETNIAATDGGDANSQIHKQATDHSEEASLYDYYDEDTSEDILANLESLDASSFLSINHDDMQHHHPLPPMFQPPMSYRKTAPAPIKIPNPTFRGTKVQLVHSSAGSNARTRPNSQGSMDEISAVSGSTLARALMANSFVLSTDTASRHRSVGSSLVQMDSATLPLGENPFLSSPMIRDRTLSWTTSVGLSPLLPPSIPPIPPNAEQVYSPPLRSRKDDKKLLTSLKRQSNEDDGSEHRQAQPTTANISANSLQPIIEISPAPSKDRFPDNVPAPTQPSTSRPDSLGALSMVTPSTATSSMSERDIGGVLDYYERKLSPDPEMPSNNGFQLPFSPITEESSSQLSPPVPYRNPNRSSRPASIILNASASSGMGRIEWLTRRESLVSAHSNSGDKGSKITLLPIGGRSRHSTQMSLDGSTESMYSTSSGTPSIAELSPPPRAIFNRQRSGSAPSPITVVRDSRDYPAYNIMVNPLSSPSNSSNSGGGSADYGQQTFPETPDLFSPTYSTEIGHGPRTPDDVPRTPQSALPFQSGFNGLPSITQQVLLTRAATSSMHNRSGSLSRSRSLHAPLGGQLTQNTCRDSDGPARTPHPLATITDHDEVSLNETSTSLTGGSNGSIRPHYTFGVNGSSTSIHSHHTFGASSSPRAHDAIAVDGTPPKDLPDLPVSPNEFEGGVRVQTPAGSTRIDSAPVFRSSRSPTVIVSYSDTPLLVPPPPPLPPPLPPTSADETTSAGHRPPSVHIPQPPIIPPPPLPVGQQEREPISPSRRPYPTDPIGNDRSSNFSIAMGSPPPYYTVVYQPPGSGTPSTGSSGQDQDPRFGPRQSISSTFSAIESGSSSPSARRRTTRPPIGPRGPTPHRERASMSSISNTGPSSNRRTLSAPLPSPRFVIPPPRWRGYTLDAAKWTFTSSQLQAIVSHAIRQSAESSSIRLLRQETADRDVPAELDRLERARTDVKTRYKVLTRRRAELLDSLTTTIPESSTLALRVVEDLKDVSVSLDHLAEELHSLDEQIGQLKTLVQVHSASALAMALRKLNASFLKEFAQAHALREQIALLENEKEEAWKHAEEAVFGLEKLRSQIASSNADENDTKRSSRITAVRKSSIRASKAGLRSARSSMVSNHRLSSGTFSGAKSAFSIDDIPPVPPIPRRPKDINTDMTGPFTALSSDGYTPNSETRAMVRAHEELCEMLGITMHDTRPRRPRSLILRSFDNNDAAVPEQPISRSRRSSSDRRTSMPDGSRLSDAYTAMIVDRQAILTTLEMLSD